MDAVGACGGGGSVAGGGTGAAGLGNGGATLGVDGAGGTGTFSAGAAAGGCGAFFADATTPSVAPMSMVHNFCSGFTVSPSLTNSSFMTPSPGDGTGTEVCKQARLNFE